MTATPASRAVRWAKDHGRPMDSTVIEAYLKGWNAGIRSTRHLRADQVAAHSNAFAMYQQAGLVTKQNDQLLAQNAALREALEDLKQMFLGDDMTHLPQYRTICAALSRCSP